MRKNKATAGKETPFTNTGKGGQTVKYEKISIWHDPIDPTYRDCEVQTYEIWKEITEEELHKFHEECIKIDTDITKSDKAVFEPILGKPWEDTPDDFEEFKAKLIANGVLRVKENAKKGRRSKP